jgi:trehalose 6-phosphate phosphatase
MTTVASRFFRQLAASPRAVLALDYDGTLAPFQRRPETAFPHPGVRQLLQRIHRAGRTRLVIISGRPSAAVRELLQLDPAPEIWGAHGWERWSPDEGLRQLSLDDQAAAILTRARAALAAHGLSAQAEWKAASVAVHWRDHPQAARIAAATHAALAPLAEAPDFELLSFAAGLELRCRRCHKGTALAAVIAPEPPEVPVAYLGDDLTDEDAFAVLAGRGLAVHVVAEPVGSQAPLATAAVMSIASGAGVIGFLERWCDATTISPRASAAGGDS